MIIKSQGRKSKTGTKQLLEYILRDDALYRDKYGKTMIITNHLRGGNISDWDREYSINETYRIHKKKNANVVYHEILAWHELDKKEITLYKLERMAREYIRLRNTNALVVATAHMDKEHPHIHFCFSGVEYKSGHSLRVSRQVFNDVKIAIEKYQEKEFPELTHSVIDFSKKKPNN